MGCHPVAVAQYTFTHKQYIEQHKLQQSNTNNNRTTQITTEQHKQQQNNTNNNRTTQITTEQHK
jgi:hypothetical protein